jgi:hypothetical protein
VISAEDNGPESSSDSLYLIKNFDLSVISPVPAAVAIPLAMDMTKALFQKVLSDIMMCYLLINTTKAFYRPFMTGIL